MAVLVVYGIDVGYISRTRQGLVFLLFGSFMALGAIYSWAYLPNIQRVVRDGDGRPCGLEPKNLEDLGEGHEKARLEGEVLTIRDKWGDFKRRRGVVGRRGGEVGPA